MLANYHLSLNLQGPLQAWGVNSQFDVRNTGFWPTKSGVAGMICAALGYPRGSNQEKDFLLEFLKIKMLVIQIPRLSKNPDFSHSIRRMHDFHTVQNTITANRKTKNTHLTNRYYLNDASFGVILEGKKELLKIISQGLKNPVWGVWLGRKTCIPASPVFAGGPFKTQQEALKILIKEQNLENFDFLEETKDFEQGTDSIFDEALSFESANRSYMARRVKIKYRKKKNGQ